MKSFQVQRRNGFLLLLLQTNYSLILYTVKRRRYFVILEAVLLCSRPVAAADSAWRTSGCRRTRPLRRVPSSARIVRVIMPAIR